MFAHLPIMTCNKDFFSIYSQDFDRDSIEFNKSYAKKNKKAVFITDCRLMHEEI